MPRSVALPGLFHSVYRTEVFELQMIPSELRDTVTSLIGAPAEVRAQLFGIIQRKSFLRQTCSVRQPVCKGSTSSVTLINRLDLDNSCIVVSGEQFRELCTLYSM